MLHPTKVCFPVSSIETHGEFSIGDRAFVMGILLPLPKRIEQFVQFLTLASFLSGGESSECSVRSPVTTHVRPARRAVVNPRVTVLSPVDHVVRTQVHPPVTMWANLRKRFGFARIMCFFDHTLQFSILEHQKQSPKSGLLNLSV